MGSFDHPSPSFESRLRSFRIGFFPPLFHVRGVLAIQNGFHRGLSFVTGIRTYILGMGGRGLGPGNHDTVQGRNQEHHIIDVGRAADDRERDATPVGEDAALASIFFPDRWGWDRRILEPKALYPALHRCIANPRQCPPFGHIPPVRPARSSRKTRLAASFENTDEWRWRCHIPSARLSTGSRCATHKRWPRRFVAAASVCARLPVCVCIPGPPAAGARE